jgi:hypothetical protein
VVHAGVNSWLKLQIRLVAAIKGFNRSWLSCKKKYKAILSEYKTDKRANEISGTDRKQECRWFNEMDEWHGSRASVRNQIPASATESWEDVIPSTPATPSTAATPSTVPTPSTQEKKKKIQEKIEILLEQVVGNSAALLTSFQESTNLLKNMDKNFAALIDKF